MTEPTCRVSELTGQCTAGNSGAEAQGGPEPVRSRPGRVQARQIARIILSGFERHYRLFRKVTAGARKRFEAADWQGSQQASRERISYYDARVVETVRVLRGRFGITELDEPEWRRVKEEYVGLLYQHKQAELAETFYNSVFCRLFERKYYNNRNIFVRPAVSTDHIEFADSEELAYRSYYPARDGFYRVISDILSRLGFSLPFAYRRRDIRSLMRAVKARGSSASERQQNFHLAVLSTPFFRNKAAYVIGKVVNGTEEIPFCVPILNNEQGGLYVDALLLGESELANVFSFARAYFMVETEVPSAVVDFLLRLLACKSKADLYTAIGLQKQGKTEFYRDFLHHLRHSSDQFSFAPGARGMVMIVFTLPSYPYVFKVIKDAFPPPKDLTREDVKRKYQLVKQHDRVGRMADSLEYSDAAFPLNRFAPELLAELCTKASTSVEIAGDQVVIKHLYIERRMTPLDVYMEYCDDEDLRWIVGDYGDAIRELAAANIFPGDMFLKNFGVTRQGRVVFYDYDEICYLTECNFRRIPTAPYPEYELSDEPWYSVGPADVFPEEFATFLLTNPKVRALFVELHGDLLDAAYWQWQQRRVLEGHFEDVFPYPQAIRFEQPRGNLPGPTPQVANAAACG
jgi:isocitrate dehydrogenase kinase/phosphatase